MTARRGLSGTAIGESVLPAGGRRISHAVLLALLTLALLIVLLTVVVTGGGTGGYDLAVLLGFGLNGLVAGVFLAAEVARRPFSLAQIHWIFYLSFLVIAPLSQYVHGSSLWGYRISVASYAMANALLFLWAISFGMFSGKRARDEGGGDFRGFHRRFFHGLPVVPRRGVVVAVALSAAATAAIVYMVGFENLFARSTFSFEAESTMEALLKDKILRGLPVMCFIVVLVRYKQRRDCAWLLVAAGALLLLADFPFGMPRYNAAMIYGGLLLLAVPAFMERRGLFPLLLLLLLVVFFPATNAFRRDEFDALVLLESLSEAVANIPEGFLNADFDAYSMLVRGVDYVESVGPTLGYQLLSALLFFVPRAIWPGKPVGSGQTVAEYQGQAYTNLSFPLPAEGYINFGIIGLVAMAVIFALVCRRCDRAFWEGAHQRWMPFYPVACFLFFFMLRGDLMSSTAYFVGFAAVFALVNRVAFLGEDPKKARRDT